VSAPRLLPAALCLRVFNHSSVPRHLRFHESLCPYSAGCSFPSVFINLQIFGPRRAEVTGGWGKSRIEELRGFYCLYNISKLIKSSRRWVRQVVHMGQYINAYFWYENLGRRVMIILEWTLGRCGLDSSGPRWEPVTRCFEQNSALQYA